jgi:hypothetical protein
MVVMCWAIPCCSPCRHIHAVACELPALLLALLLHAFLFSFLALLAGINSCTQDTGNAIVWLIQGLKPAETTSVVHGSQMLRRCEPFGLQQQCAEAPRGPQHNEGPDGPVVLMVMLLTRYKGDERRRSHCSSTGGCSSTGVVSTGGTPWH